jgi:hypothetical protein
MTLSSEAYATFVTLSSICGLIGYVVFVAGLWKTFTKAGMPGWTAVIPILNLYYIVKMSGHPGWWVLLFFVPILNIVIWLMVSLDVAYAFGKNTLYGVLLFFLPWVMYLLLGFGDAKYNGPHPV